MAKNIYIIRNSRGIGIKGTAMVEFAIVLPFLALIFSAITDISRALTEYSRLSEAVHQGARVASGISSLRTIATYDGLSSAQNGCVLGMGEGIPSSSTEKEMHRQVQEKVERIILVDSENPIGLCISTGLELNATNQKNIRVSATSTYRSIFPMFDGLSIKASAVSPFLQG